MNEQTEIQTIAHSPVVKKRRGIPLVWLLPLVALFVSSWLIYKSILDKGPAITITFDTAEGFEVDKTKVKYKDVTVGNVTDISFDRNLSKVTITANMNKDVKNYLNEKTRFWVVKPHVGVTGISGLGTLLSGPYIEMEPGDGKRRREFIGLEDPPLVKSDVKGRRFVLYTDTLGSLKRGSPVHFQGLRVGEVLDHNISKDGQAIDLNIFIENPFDKFVRGNSRFWRDSGIHASVSADGIEIRTGSLESIIGGGISFSTPSGQTVESKEHERFHLHADFRKANEIVYNKKIRYVMYFDGSVRGLKPGAPVDLRGIQIGEVASIQLQIAGDTAEILIPVVVELEPERVKEFGHHSTMSDEETIEYLVQRGLRAQLQTGSLVTGQLFIEMDFHTDEPIRKVAENLTPYPQFPTIPTILDQFSITAKAAIKRFSELPLEEIAYEVSGTLKELKTTLVSANQTLVTANQTLHTADSALGTFKEGASARYQLENALTEMTGAARSVRLLTDYLEQYPDSLVLGKPQ